MTGDTQFRRSTSSDVVAIEALYPRAFPDEDLVPLVRSLLSDHENVDSIVGEVGSEIVGHAIYSRCSTAETAVTAALLGPVAVAPSFQQRGIGSAIIRDCLQRLEQNGFIVVCVLGDPTYYSRFGFETETSVQAPYPLPVEWAAAWQSIWLDATASKVADALAVPAAWRDPALWAP